MKISIVLAVGIFFLGTTGCSQVPVSGNYPLAENDPMYTQKKVKAAHHWDIIADDVVTQTVKSIEANNYLQGNTFYVQPASDVNTAFNKAFRNFLITRMVNRGLSVSDIDSGAVEIQYETQVVQHQIGRYYYQPVLSTAPDTGALVARDIVWPGSDSTQAGGVSGQDSLAVVNIEPNADGTTDFDFIVTSSIVVDGRFVMRKTDVYYLEGADLGLFMEYPPIPLKNGLPAREWKVVAQ